MKKLYVRRTFLLFHGALSWKTVLREEDHGRVQNEKTNLQSAAGRIDGLVIIGNSSFC